MFLSFRSIPIILIFVAFDTNCYASFFSLRSFSFFSTNNTNITATATAGTTSGLTSAHSINQFFASNITILPTITTSVTAKPTTRIYDLAHSSLAPPSYHYYDHQNYNGSNESPSNNGIVILNMNETIILPTNLLVFGEDRIDFNPFSNKTQSEYLSSDVPSNDGERGYEIVIQNDKTVAYLRFDKDNQNLTYCELFDLEKEPPMIRLSLVISKFGTLVVSHKTMMEAVRKCSALAIDSYYADIIPTISSTNSSNGSSSSTTSRTDLPEPLPLISTESSIQNSTSKATLNITSSATTKPSTFDWTVNHFYTFWRGIMPGTKWCGLGDLADRYEDLGWKLDIDLCCRAHDHCPIRLKAFRMGYGIFNFSFYSRLHCDCDDDFYRCLKRSPKPYAAMLGHFYFNVLKIQCLKEDPNANTIVNPSFNNSTPQMVCLKKRADQCVQFGLTNPDSMPDSRMKIISFGKHF